MIYGWDVSTSIVGVAIFNDDGSFRTATHCDLRKIEGFPIEKASAIDEFIIELADRPGAPYGPGQGFGTVHYLEDRLGNFSAGMTTMQTLMKLAAFNAMVSYMIHVQWGDPVIHLHPSTWKSIMKKEGLIIPKGADKKALTLEFVQKREPLFEVELNRNGKPQPWCFDRADAYCIGRAGYLKHEPGAQAGGPKKGAR